MTGTFITIGNSPRHFTRLLDGILRIYHLLPQPVIVQHGRTPFSHPEIEHFPFVDEAGFLAHVAKCSLLITHGGGGSVFSALKMGKTPVVMPRRASFGECVDDHQAVFAVELARQEKVVVAENTDDLLKAAHEALSRPPRSLGEARNTAALQAIAKAVAEFAPRTTDCVSLVTPSGGHLTEIRELSEAYRDHPHFFVVNVPLVEPPDMKGRTIVITLSERDWKFLVNLWEAFSILRTRRPSVILTTGGSFSVAFAVIGKLFRIPTIYIETVAKVNVPTMTGRLMYKLADRFFYQWNYLRAFFPNGEYIGLIL
jgi:UDP-N-acetylglucosamine transferase subunit ALG13